MMLIITVRYIFDGSMPPTPHSDSIEPLLHLLKTLQHFKNYEEPTSAPLHHVSIVVFRVHYTAA